MQKPEQLVALPYPHGANQRSERLLRFREVATRTCLSKSEIYRRIGSGTFPKSVKLGQRAVAWRESDIEVWIRNLAQ